MAHFQRQGHMGRRRNKCKVTRNVLHGPGCVMIVFINWMVLYVYMYLHIYDYKYIAICIYIFTWHTFHVSFFIIFVEMLQKIFCYLTSLALMYTIAE